ncbi:hypothetical protein [Variovorax sp. OK605]|uniref:hypothetical protein n=1 Tax=Variovorax sp. OK605 TaxID=1855317 RepID=UPI001160C860|nr:hypothetical protein [Variovorax sp. OK605]
MPTEFENVAGYLCRLSEEESAKDLFAQKKEVGNWQVIIENAWYSFDWDTPSGVHKFLLRDGKDRFMLMTDDHVRVNNFFAICGIENRIERPRVAIASFVKDLVAPVNEPERERPGRTYRVSSIFASIDGYGRSLKTVALWGDDLLNAALFNTILSQVSPYRVTVRELLRDTDIVSAGSGGEVNFLYRGAAQLRKVDSFFRYLKQHGLIKWAWARSGGDE